MDWNYFKKLLRVLLGAMLLLGGFVLMILSFTAGYGITLAFLAFLLLALGVYTALLGVHILREE